MPLSFSSRSWPLSNLSPVRHHYTNNQITTCFCCTMQFQFDSHSTVLFVLFQCKAKKQRRMRIQTHSHPSDVCIHIIYMYPLDGHTHKNYDIYEGLRRLLVVIVARCLHHSFALLDKKRGSHVIIIPEPHPQIEIFSFENMHERDKARR
jgi:hypothetical protein